MSASWHSALTTSANPGKTAPRTRSSPGASAALSGCQGLACWCVQLDVLGGQVFLEVAH
jgi:hypothetical protein